MSKYMITQTERPTRADYRETKKLFDDFRVPVQRIPEFETVSALVQWRTKQIRAYLDQRS